MQPPSGSGPPLAPLGPGDPVLIGGYRVLARIGTGRRGPVFLAATQSGRRLAIKAVRPELAGDEAFRRRFKSGIAAAQRVRGPFLAPVVDGHAEGASPWTATEYVPGPSLARAVAESGPLPEESVRALLGALGQALQAVHDADMAHGDLKPSNVLLAEDGPRLVDQGFAEAEAEAEHEPGTADDVFALGRLAYFAATGRDLALLDDGSADLSACPEGLRGPIERCLAADPADRPEPGALAAELEEEPPGPGWPPSAVAALLPGYREEPPRPAPAPLPRAQPVFEPPAQPMPSFEPPAQPVPAGAPNFAMPEPPQTMPMSVPAGPDVLPPVMDSYRHDLAIALGIGGGAFGLLVLILLLVFLL
jgi:serine/threonine protein kinase